MMLRFETWVILPISIAAAALIGAGCSRTQSTQSLMPLKSPPAISSTPKPTPAPTENFYQSALDSAASARSISQSAQSSEDWQLVASRWKNAIAALKQVPKADPNRKLANQKLAEFNQALANAEARAEQTGKEKIAALDPVVQADRAISAVEIASIAAQKAQGFQVPIKYRKNRIPVIDVLFNGGQRFEMMLDTGASATMITEEMAQRLGTKTIDEMQVMTAAGVTTVKIVVVKSISVAGNTIQNVPVSIGPLDVGLLGHDFFGDCDISIQRDVVEFRKCNP